MTMNGNKPIAKKFTSNFTERIAAHPRVAYYPIPHSNDVVMMVVDELLVCGDVVKKNNSLFGHLKSGSVHVGSVLDSHNDLVQIWRLTKTPGNRKVPDVAYA